MRNLRLSALLALAFFFLGNEALVYAQSGIYDRIGLITEHGLHGAVPEENLDLFTGNLTLRFLDINLPGPNGLDLKIWRVYNSKILKDLIPGSAWGIQQEPYSWVGMGWSMHMGRVHYYDQWPLIMPVIEFPDGRWETAWLSTDGSCCYTRDFSKYDHINFKLYFKDGTVWTFGQVANINYIGATEQVRLVTRIDNSYGHHIDIIYKTGLPVVSKITDSLGREVNFVTTGTTNPKLDRIYVKDAHNNTQNYYYTVGAFPYGGYYQLTEFQPPLLPAATYEYYNGQSSHFELTKANTPYGGSMAYAYADKTFYFYVTSLTSRVVTQKKIKFSPSGTEYAWNYTYPDYHNVGTGTVNVQGPVYNTDATYNAYTSSTPWKIGLLHSKVLTDGSFAEQYAWDSQVLSNKHWFVLNVDMGPGTGPLISSVSRSRKGDAASKEEYLYERAAVKKYGLPTRINFYGNPGTLKSYKNLTYYFESNSTFAGKYMLSYPSDEKTYSGSGTLLKQTQTAYYDYPAGSCGAIDWIKRLKSSGTYLTWNYAYSSSNPNLITITVYLPGNGGTETYEYRYGTLSKVLRPGFTELTRTISQYESSILTETNQHGGTLSFTYDGLSRIKRIDLPSGFNAVTASWADNSVTISRGSNTVVKYWDGMGRDTGSVESGDGISLYYRKSLDAEGRLVSESKGSTSSSDTYAYELTALGQVKKITDPRGKITNISYATNTKTVTDPESHVTVSTYNDLPGLVTRLKDARALYADSAYDALGRLTGVVYSSARTQSYAYDGLDNVTSETHPETGALSYTISAENNLSQRSWGGTTINYGYNASNQLTSLNAGDETITYGYDTMGRVNSISSTKSWGRNSISYNALGSVTGETQTIPGLTAKTLSYDYDANGILKEVTYPDGKKASTTNNGLNAPETLSFNSKSIINAVSYGYVKQPTAVTISGNASAFSASYDAAGQLSLATLTKGAGTLYNASYTYDGVGNITAVSNTTPQLNGAFGYDSVDRLTSATYTPSGIGRVNSFTYAYDSYGNMTLVKENNVQVFSASYTSANRISGFTYDNRGNCTADGVSQFVWDNQNRLTTLKNSGGQDQASYLYNERGLRLKASRSTTLSGQMLVLQGKDLIAHGSSYGFASRAVYGFEDQVFTVENKGMRNLILGGIPRVAVLGANSDQFEIVKQPDSPVGPEGSTTFIVRFKPNAAGFQNARISIANDSPGQNPYSFLVVGTGILPDNSSEDEKGDFNNKTTATSCKGSILVVFPNADDDLFAGSRQDILWAADQNIKEVRLEYSTDNGTTYRTIADSAPNTGCYGWAVPRSLSSACLVRITSADGLPAVSNLYSLEMAFKIRGQSPASQIGQIPDFHVRLSTPEPALQGCQIWSELSFSPVNTPGKANILFNDRIVGQRGLEEIINEWHRLVIEMDVMTHRGSLRLDGRLIAKDVDLNLKRSAERTARLQVSGCQDTPGTLWLDDVRFGVRDQDQERLEYMGDSPQIVQTLVQDGFEAYPEGELPAIGGWLTEQDMLPGFPGKFLIETGNSSSVDTVEHSSGNQSFKLESRWGWPVVAAKSFDLPDIAPYGLSDGSFRIEATGDSLEELRKADGIKSVETDRSQSPTKPKEKKSPGEPEGGDPYYFYSFDGKLMAEYDENGNCISDFIYMGNRLVAEYRPQESKYYYYASDQINSTRMVTDDSGAIVSSTTFDPFGGIEKAWVSTYDPTLKFSGKEREPANEMDYFGARYYAHTRYRWISPDPVVPVDVATSNPQGWNLYSYVRNNPLTYYDPSGLTITYQNADLRSLFESLAKRSSLVHATLSLYEGENGPNLVVRYAEAGLDKDRTPANGTFDVEQFRVSYSGKESQLIPGMTVEQIEDLGVWSITGGKIVIDNSLSLSWHDKQTVGTALHELGHADQAVRATLQYKRQCGMDRRPDGTLRDHDERPVEIYANRYRAQALKETK